MFLPRCAENKLSSPSRSRQIRRLATAEVTQLREQVAAQVQEKEAILLKGKELENERDHVRCEKT